MSPAVPASPMSHVITPDELERVGAALMRPFVLVELSVFVGCLMLAFGVTLLMRRVAASSGAALEGEPVLSSPLFPVLALLFTLLARQIAFSGDLLLPVFRLGVPILFSLAVIRIVARVLRVALPRSQFIVTVERTISWIAWVGSALWITGLLPMFLEELDAITWKVGSGHLSLRNAIEGGLSALAVLIFVLWLSSLIETRLLKGQTENLSVRKMAANAARAILLLVGVLLSLSAAGIDLTALSVLGGALGVGLGFGLQKLASNYVSGFVILAERSVRIGDLVKVDNFEGRITDINTRYTVIRSNTGRESIVPNEVLITQRVENASLADASLMASTVLLVPYGTDVLGLRPKMLEALNSVERVMKDKDHAPAVHLTNFAPDGLELTVWYWNPDPINGQSNLRSEVNLALLAVLDAEGIEIPFPQRVVHHRSDAAAAERTPGVTQVLPRHGAARP